jgi:predicted RNA-binding protein YlqC (UPF0109 family)
MSAVAPAPSSPEKQPRTPTRGPKLSQRATSSAKSTSSSEDNNTDGLTTQPRDDVLNSIATLQTAISLSTITITLYIPTTAVGAVIGRKGQNIASLQKLAASCAAIPHSAVRISVVGQQHDADIPATYSDLDWSDPQWTPVVIRADPCAALTAIARVQDVVPNFDQVVMDIPLQRSRHATVVGKRGLTLASLSADHKVRIMVPNKDLRHDMIQLEGDYPNVKQCFHAILRLVASKGNQEASLLVPQLPSHTKLRQVGRKTDTVIRKKKVDDTTWLLTVTGTGQVQAAVTLLQKWKDELDGVPPPPPRRVRRNIPKGAPKRKPVNNASS